MSDSCTKFVGHLILSIVLHRRPFLLLAALCASPRVTYSQSDSVARLDPVVVTVTRGAAKSVLDAPFALTVVRPNSSRPGQRHTQIDESLALVPGLIATNRNNPAQDPRLSIRGYGARSAFGVRGIRVLRDGMPLTLPDGQTPIDYLSLGSVDRIEVMRGAASALYGNAGGGVIDFRSAAPPSGLVSANLRQLLGDNGFSRTSLAAGGTSSGIFYQGDAALSRSDGIRAHSRQRANSGYGRIGTTFRQTSIIFSALGLNNPLAENPGALTLDELNVDPTIADALSVRRNARKTVNQVQVGVAVTRPLAKGEISASAFEGARTLYNPLTFAIVEVGRHTYGASARLSQALSVLGLMNRWTAGIDLQSQNDLRRNLVSCADTIASTNPTASCPTVGSERGAVTLHQRELVSSAGAYLSDDIAIGSRVAATAGVRWDRVRFEVRDRFISGSNPDDSGKRLLGAVSPVVGGVFRFAPGHSLYSNISSAFETPTATELGNHPDGSAGINQSLEPQRSTTIEAGVKGFFGLPISYDLAGFTTRVTDELVPFEIPGSNGRRYFRNAGRTRRTGVEAGGHAAYRALTLQATYAYSRFRFDSYKNGNANYDGNLIPGVPRHRAQVALKVSGLRSFAVVETETAGKLFLDDANSAVGPGYTVATMRFGGELPVRQSRVALTAGIQNVFDRHYASSFAVNAARGKYFEPAATRNFFVGLSVQAERGH